MTRFLGDQRRVPIRLTGSHPEDSFEPVVFATQGGRVTRVWQQDSAVFAGMYPGQVLAEFKAQRIAEGYPWEESRWPFQADSGADERLQQIGLEILESMLFSFEWVVQGEPIPGDRKRSTLNPASRDIEIDDDKDQEFEARVQSGFDLFGKYYLPAGRM